MTPDPDPDPTPDAPGLPTPVPTPPPVTPPPTVTGRVAQVIVASTRAATGVYTDRTGPVIDAWLADRGWLVLDRAVVVDGDPVGDALAAAIEAGLDLVITTGGTGVSPSDQTPEQTLPLLTRELPGIMEELRRRGTAATPLAVLSRGYAGVARGRTVVINLPGSTGGVQDGLAVLDEVLDHLLDQLHGADHEPPAPRPTPHDRQPAMSTEPESTPSPAQPTAGTVLFARVDDSPITVDECTDAVGAATAGAVVSFAGVVRNHDEDRGVTWLRYSAHPSAQAELAAVARDIARAHPGCRIAAAHRVGDLAIGDVALACAVASAHRAEAFAACAALVDEIKTRVPIWKEQGFTDGSTEWVAALG